MKTLLVCSMLMGLATTAAVAEPSTEDWNREHPTQTEHSSAAPKAASEHVKKAADEPRKPAVAARPCDYRAALPGGSDGC